MAPQGGQCIARRGSRSLARADRNRLGTGTGTLVRRQLEIDRLTFRQPFETSPRDDRVMEEYVRTATSGLNEPETFVAH